MDNFADTTKAPPASIDLDYQPYGKETLTDLRWGEYNGFPTLSGTVIEGSQTSRIFQHTHTSSTVGRPRTIYGVKSHEIECGLCVRIAM